jgi:hypothetical protein
MLRAFEFKDIFDLRPRQEHARLAAISIICARTALNLLRSWHRDRSRRFLYQRQSEVKRNAFAKNALSPDAPAVGLDDVLDDGETQAGSARLARASLVDTIEALKDALQVFRGNAGPKILHSELHL